MFQKYDNFANSLSAPTACSNCGQATPHHNYYPHLAATAALSSVATIMAFAIPLLLWAQSMENNTPPPPPPPANNQTSQGINMPNPVMPLLNQPPMGGQMNPGNFQGQPNGSNQQMNQNNFSGQPNNFNRPTDNQGSQMNHNNFQPNSMDQPSQFRQFNQVDPMSLGPINQLADPNRQFDPSTMKPNDSNQLQPMGNQPAATCRINGQEQPGPCSQFN